MGGQVEKIETQWIKQGGWYAGKNNWQYIGIYLHYR